MSKRSLILMCSIFLIVPLLFMGCGSDGAAGPAGATGATGATGASGASGPAGPVTNTNESCMVCHTTGRIADISDGTAGMHYAPGNSLPTLTVGNIVVSDNGSGNLLVNFNVKIDNTTAYTGLGDNNVTFITADLVPAGTVPFMLDNNLQSTPQFERWAYERNASGYAYGTLQNLGSGNYAYTFATPLGSTTAYDNAQHFSYADIQRLYIRLAVTPNGTYTNGVGFVDFTVNGPAGARVDNPDIGYNARQFVTIDACKKCHGGKLQKMGHGTTSLFGNGYRDTRACTICHSPIINATNPTNHADDPKTNMANGLWLGNWIHKIHSALTVNSTEDFSDVTFPQDVRNCVVCHTNSGVNLGAGDNTANWMTHPTAAYCGTCHITVNFLTGAGHPGGAQATDTFCAGCHPATGHVPLGVGASVTDAHDTSATSYLHPNSKNVPEYDVSLGLSAGSGSGYYKAGDIVTVTATLMFHGTSTPVPATVYTHAKGAAGIADNALYVASVAIYGPRALPKPIFAPTDNSQSFSLFMGTTPTSGAVITDNTGFKYRFTVPSGLASGTYMVRARFADYGYVNDSNYKMESIAFQNIQIGSATVTPKVSGTACTNCHGNGTAPWHDARHVVAFDTDQCISCHDYSGGHAATLSNRVHAVHSANTFGDMTNTQSQYTTAGGFVSTVSRNWSDVTYPQYVSNCSTCHNSGNTSYRSKVHEVACLGCHGDNPYTGGATNHMLQNGGDYPAP